MVVLTGLYRGTGQLVHSCGRILGTTQHPSLGLNRKAGPPCACADGRGWCHLEPSPEVICQRSRCSFGACGVGGLASQGFFWMEASLPFRWLFWWPPDCSPGVPVWPQASRQAQPDGGEVFASDFTTLVPTPPRFSHSSLTLSVQWGCYLAGPTRDLQSRCQGLLEREKKQTSRNCRSPGPSSHKNFFWTWDFFPLALTWIGERLWDASHHI